MKEKNNIISLSGGKDSTAMLLLMIEKAEPIHSVVFFDTGWEFPQMYEHIDKLERYTGIKIWRLQSRMPFEYWMTARPIIAKKGPMKGKVHRIGNGWPSPSRRWCTRLKVDAINYFAKPIENAVQCVGYAADEIDRAFSDELVPHRFPLQEYGITEAEALKICYRHGFDWGGLYEHFNRASCFCCPLKGSPKAWKKIRQYYPEQWKKMLQMDKSIIKNRGFYGYKTVHDLEKRFAEEDRQMKLFSKEATV